MQAISREVRIHSYVSPFLWSKGKPSTGIDL